MQARVDASRCCPLALHSLNDPQEIARHSCGTEEPSSFNKIMSVESGKDGKSHQGPLTQNGVPDKSSSWLFYENEPHSCNMSRCGLIQIKNGVVRLTIEHAENKVLTSGERTCNDSFDLSNRMRPSTSVAVGRSRVSLNLSVPLRRCNLTG